MSMPYQKYTEPSGLQGPFPGYHTGHNQQSSVLEYWPMFGKVFEHPNWLSNILLVMITSMIPVVGPLVVLGYRYEVLDHRLRNPNSWDPAFDFGRFADYLARGVWPFVTGILSSLIAMPLMFVLWLAFWIGMGLIGMLAQSIDPALGILVMVLWFFGLFVVMMLSSGLIAAVGLPMNLAAGVGQDLGQAFNFEFIKSFLRLMWKEVLLGSLFYTVMSGLFICLGYLALCVGVLPATALVYLAFGNLEQQLYSIYLMRGGTPIPSKTPTASTAQQPYRTPAQW